MWSTSVETLWSTPVKTLINIFKLLIESYYIIFFFLFISFILIRVLNHTSALKAFSIKNLYNIARYFSVFEVLSLKWKCTWGFVICYLRSKRVPYFKI